MTARDRKLLEVGDKLDGLVAPGTIQARVGSKGIVDIVVDQLPGPMGLYLVAKVTYDSGRLSIIPLHLCEEIVRAPVKA